MGRGGRVASHPQRRAVDLTGIVSVAEKNDLIILVTAISEKMYRDINHLFNSQQVTPADEEDGLHNWLSLALSLNQDERNSSGPSTAGPYKPPKPTATTPSHKNSDTDSGEDSDIAPQLQELKKEAIAFFRKWQAVLLQRLRDIGVSDIEPEQTCWRGRGRGTRGRSRARIGRVGRGGRGSSTLATGPPRVPSNHLDSSLVRLYSPIPNTLWPLPYERRKLFLHIMLLVMLSLHDYNANSRILLINLASSLNLPLRVCHEDETRIAQGLAEAALEVSPERAAAQKEENKLSKRWKFSVSGASGGNGNGIAAALTAVGIGTAHRGLGLTSNAASALLGVMSENGLLMGSLFGLNPSKPLVKIVEACLREVQDFSILALVGGEAEEYSDARQIHPEHRRLGIVIAMSGFLIEYTSMASPWTCLGPHTEKYIVQWETSAVTGLGAALETVIRSTAWGMARAEIRKSSIFRCLLDSKWPVSLLKISKIIDNPWSVGMVRAEKVGSMLADIIMRHKFHGERPVSLVGYSLASRAIYTCLMVLAERRQFGLIDSVVLIGTPAPAESRVWLTMKSVITGRLVNVYSEEDYILGFLYRTSNTQAGIAGLQEIHGANGVENYRVNSLSNGHLSYQRLLKDILKDIDWEYVASDGCWD